jgi:retron-type reverse transcriptase
VALLAQGSFRGGFAFNQWWGRRDLIPPTSDARTLLIDRAMVTQGLLTPEELVEIHRVGDEMLRIKGDLLAARAEADAAVIADKAAREERKKQKKAEAAERDRRHAEGVARRKATDILYLGRGVSAGLADRRANVEKLAARGLPVLATPADVANVMGLTIPRLRWLAFHSEASTLTHYVRFAVTKKSGGMRELSAPHAALAAAQGWVFTNILSKLPAHEAAHGFVRGRNTLTNARPHVGRAVVVNADLENFFPTVTFGRVRGAFAELGYSPAVATIFALLCTEAPRRQVSYAGKLFHVATGPRALPQGACTSPALSNLVARRMDSRLAGICRKMEWTYTRYADDLTLSANGEAAKKVGYMLARLRHIAQDEGFVVNEKKTRVLRPNTSQRVTGIVVNHAPGVPRTIRRKLRAAVHRAKKEGRTISPQVAGMVAYVQMVNLAQAAGLRRGL